MENKKRDNLKKYLEQTEERLVKENQKIVLFMTIYFIFICGGMIHSQYDNMKDIIVESVILGVVVSLITTMLYVVFSTVMTNKKSLENLIVQIKIKIDREERGELLDENDEDNGIY